ncbi:MAG: hypothetical protein J2P43_07265 [Candidatus Dormibacteraeota bacterium]|nr:hypothetical protein [Candidatus Dormibacteraeota bacterium]
MGHRFRLAVLFLAGVLFAAAAWPGALRVEGASIAGAASSPTSEADCNGYSSTYAPVRVGMKELCTDPIWIGANGQTGRFYDNGHYVGHDEPSVKFISNDPGSASNITYLTRLSTDPRTPPTVPGSGPVVTDYAELSPAPWFGLPLCDPNSYPQNPCTPDSDSNGSGVRDPNAAGSAFMELQFYPPGYQPFIDGPSCDGTHWCAALTIDSLECNFGFATCNRACEEPVNFAYLQTNGVPAGPPAPLSTNVRSFTPNRFTLMMNPGDALAVTIKDTPQGLLTAVVDLSTHQVGWMVASGTNGFANSNPQTCANTPFDFRPEFSSASQQNQVPWAALEGGVLMEDELGHFQACSSETNPFPVSENVGGQVFQDPRVDQTCVGGSEGPGATGEGPCTVLQSGAATCQNATTEGGAPCPTSSAGTALCEFSDALCMPAGPREINLNGTLEEVSWPIAGCQDNIFQNGDLDFDGMSYQANWPDGSPLHPTSFQYLGPFDGRGQLYPQVQFETDVGGSEADCNTRTGAGCTALPAAADFYPFWTIGRTGGACIWNFGNTIPGVTVQNFGGDAQYGTPDVARFGGTLTSPVLPNPEFNAQCGPVSFGAAQAQMH